MKKVSVILPTYNERENIIQLIYSLKKHINNPLEIIVIDDNSPDRTSEIVRKSKIEGLKLITRKDTKGLASAIAHGVSSASGDIIIWMDADMSHPPNIAPKLIKETEKYDIVVASRYVNNGKDIRQFIRQIASLMVVYFARIILSTQVKDWTSGYIAVRKKVFKKVKIMPEGYGQYFISFLYLCITHNFKIKEIGFINNDRVKGKSKAYNSLFGLFKLGYEYCKEIIKLRLGLSLSQFK